jgi:hypothetical protein
MEGVRRWIGTHPISNSDQSSRHPIFRDELNKTIEPELDPHSTEAIALQLLNPSVSDDEELEYQGYIDQCQELLEAPTTIAERKDLDVYHAAVLVATKEGHDETSDEALMSYIEKGSAQFIDGVYGLPVLFSYERWLGQYA